MVAANAAMRKLLTMLKKNETWNPKTV